MKLDGFSTLYMDKLLSLKSIYRGLEHEDEMVGLYNHCTFNLNPRATSIDTTLHGFVPHRHVDHVHADAVIAIAASENAEALTKEIYGGELGFLPWQRPGFDLGLKLGAMAEANPNMKGVVLGGPLMVRLESLSVSFESALTSIRFDPPSAALKVMPRLGTGSPLL